METKYTNTQQAYERGQEAFEAGMSSAAVHDAEFMSRCPFGDIGSSLPMLVAWDSGWHDAHRKAVGL